MDPHVESSLLIAKKYKLEAKIGSGSFGEIYEGVCNSSGKHFAVKLEPKANRQGQLEREANIYQSFRGAVGIPSVYHFGSEGDYNALVMDLLGPSLEDLFNYCGRKFSAKTVLMLGIQMLHRLEFIHSKNVISRDIKPDNFLMGRGPTSNTVYLIDYGLAKPLFTQDGKHVPYSENKKLSGTVRYASINMHIGIAPSRRDDLEGLGYVLIYFLTGSLPWQGMKGATREFKYIRIAQSKIETSIQDLCQGNREFELYIEYCRSLKFSQRPDYSYLRSLFMSKFRRLGFKYDFKWDWVNIIIQVPRRQPPARVQQTSTWGLKPTEKPKQKVVSQWDSSTKPWDTAKTSSVVASQTTTGWDSPPQNSGWAAQASGWDTPAQASGGETPSSRNSGPPPAQKSPTPPPAQKRTAVQSSGWDSPQPSSSGWDAPAQTPSRWDTSPQPQRSSAAQKSSGWDSPEPSSSGWGAPSPQPLPALQKSSGWDSPEPSSSSGWGGPAPQKSSGWESPQPSSSWDAPTQPSSGWDAPAQSSAQPSSGWEPSHAHHSGWGSSPVHSPTPPHVKKSSGWESLGSGWDAPAPKSSGWESPQPSGWDKTPQPSSSGWDAPAQPSAGWDAPAQPSGWETSPVSSSGWDQPQSSGWEPTPSQQQSWDASPAQTRNPTVGRESKPPTTNNSRHQANQPPRSNNNPQSNSRSKPQHQQQVWRSTGQKDPQTRETNYKTEEHSQPGPKKDKTNVRGWITSGGAWDVPESAPWAMPESFTKRSETW